MLQGKKIILGVCGSIAAYKAAILTRLLTKQGAEVRIIATTSALEFITPLTLATLSKNPVISDFKKDSTGEWNNHVELGLWADAMIIAPATANTLAKMANGFCDNLLLATYLSARCPVFIAPAMDLDMYQHPATISNLSKLKGYGNHIIDAEHGELASGLIGTGRMAEPEHISEHLEHFFFEKLDFKGRKILITAGPTYESIDPVRFIGNHSSGKMGFAIAEEMANRGGAVTLVSGPTSLMLKNSTIQRKNVTSAKEMFEACADKFDEADIVILAAAVADYKPKVQHEQKVKKKSDEMAIELVKTHDIAAELGKRKKGQFVVGFALETEKELEHAQGKLEKKNFNFIVLNTLNDEGAGFGHDTNKITIVRSDGAKPFQLKPKSEVASDIANEILHDITG